MLGGGGGIIFMASEGEVIGLLLGDWSTWTTSIVRLQLQTHAEVQSILLTALSLSSLSRWMCNHTTLLALTLNTGGATVGNVPLSGWRYCIGTLASRNGTKFVQLFGQLCILVRK